MPRVNVTMNDPSALRVIEGSGDPGDNRCYLFDVPIAVADTVLKIVPLNEHAGHVPLPFGLSNIVEDRDVGVFQ
jgi:hypothetical protein